MVLLLFSVFILSMIESCSDSERNTKPKIKYTENPLVQKSLEDHVTPIIESFEIEKLKKWGFSPPYDLDKNVFEEKYGISVLGHTKQSKVEMDLGYMYGVVFLTGSSNMISPEFWNMEQISLNFVKLSKNQPWKLITYEGHIEDYKSLIKDDPQMLDVLGIISPEIQTYIKSKFKTITQRDYILSPSINAIYK